MSTIGSASHIEKLDEIHRLRDVLGSAINMLELIASKMPAGADVRNAIEAECAAMRSAAVTPTTKSDAQRAFEKAMGQRENPLHPMFRDHNCGRCLDGKRPCKQGNPSRCEYPHARKRND